jgi:hypothetical protein
MYRAMAVEDVEQLLCNKNASMMKKTVFVILALATLATLALLVFALVYANAESPYRKYAIVIGLLFILFARLTLSSYNAFISGGHEVNIFKRH